jgi:hypothetical protein
MANKAEVRRYPRAKVPGGLFVGWQVGAQRFVSRLDNIAIGGAFIRTPNPPSLESPIKLVVSAPGGYVRAMAVVRQTAPKLGMGIEFTSMTTGDRGRLAGLVKQLLDKQSAPPN